MASHIENPGWVSELGRLHRLAADDSQRWSERREKQKTQPPSSGPDPLIRMGELFLSVNSQEGRLLYLLARNAKAKYMVEFGSSYGISTLYLGAAAKDMGGRLITTEVHPDKCKAVRQTLKTAELDKTVELIEGDARETLPKQKPGIDLLFLDGWKSQYLPLLSGLQPLLAPSALVVADNINHSAAADYAKHVQQSQSWFTELIGDFAVSIFQD